MLIVAGVAVAFWQLSGTSGVLEILQWTTAALAAVTALVGFGWTATNALRRHLLVTSPLGAAAVLRTSDPMAELERRYAFLVRSAGTPVAIEIDNLDRCRAEYVVELLEGIQTLLRDPQASRDLPRVAFVVAADREWLCDSYVTRVRRLRGHRPTSPDGRSGSASWTRSSTSRSAFRQCRRRRRWRMTMRPTPTRRP